MSVEAIIVEGPLQAWGGGPAVDGAGAMLVFEGIVRGLEAGRVISALRYEAYEPMARKMLHELGTQVVREHGLIRMLVQHSTGTVPAGRVSFRLVIWSVHRKESLAAADEFIALMKRDVPIWKKPVFAEEHRGKP